MANVKEVCPANMERGDIPTQWVTNAKSNWPVCAGRARFVKPDAHGSCVKAAPYFLGDRADARHPQRLGGIHLIQHCRGGKFTICCSFPTLNS